MGQNFLSCDRDQELLLPPSLRDWLPADHLAWFVLDAVETMDLQAFYGSYRADGHGRAAHEPSMMVALLLYSYALGERSSRKIERRCYEDVPTRVICANRTPDHATISRFRARHQDALAETFTEVLALCGRAGLVSVGLVAVDGTLIAGNASAAATRTHQTIREEVDRILKDAAQIDAAEDDEHGERRGDELPAELRDRRSRLARLKRCREELEAEQAQVQAAYEAKLRWRQEWEQEHGRRLAGRQPAPPDPAALAKRFINTTDPDARRMRRGGKALQGYNVQAVASPEQIILAAEVTQRANDSGQLEPMIERAIDAVAAAKIDGTLDVVLADGGYWNSPQITRLGDRDLTVIVPTKAAGRTKPRTLSQRQGPEADRIDRLLDSAEGAALYRRRQQLIEPVFANTKWNRRIDRFQRRGLAACRAEWQLIAATHNLLKLWRASRPALVA
jgi:transposase